MKFRVVSFLSLVFGFISLTHPALSMKEEEISSARFPVVHLTKSQEIERLLENPNICPLGFFIE